MKQGFFGMNKYEKKPSRKRMIPGCGACKLNKDCRSPKMKPSGKGKKGILIVGESPSRREDRSGKASTGDGGKILERVLSENGISLERDCLKTNAVRCHYTIKKDEKDNSVKYIEYCRPNVIKLIAEYKPKLILLLGKHAVRSVIGHSFHKKIDGIGRWRGYAIPDRNFKAWVCPTFHPVFLLRQNKEQYERAFERDITNALHFLNRDPPVYSDEDESVEILTNVFDIKAYLRGLLRRKPILTAFDYEGTGLKPHAPGHTITSVAIAESESRSVSFPMLTPIKPLFRKYLRSNYIYKIAANMKFEESWSRVLLGQKVNHWFFDTMIAGHALDNRSGITGLKFQTYINFGVGDYDSHIEPYLKSDRKNANSINNIRKAPLRDVLKYGGMDSLWEFRLAMIQLRKLGILDPEHFVKKRRDLWEYSHARGKGTNCYMTE